MNAEEGYIEVRNILKKEYGDPFKVSTAYVSKVHKWSPVKYDNGTTLKSFSVFLNKCKHSMTSNSYLCVLEHVLNLKSVVLKLPLHLQGKWREHATKMRNSDQTPSFKELTEFIEAAADAACDPVFDKSALAEAHNSSHSIGKDERKPDSRKKPDPRAKARVDAFATAKGKSVTPPVPETMDVHGARSPALYHTPVTNETGSVPTLPTASAPSPTCLLCHVAYDLDDC